MIDWNEFRTASQVMASKIVKRGRISSTTGSGRGDTGDRFLVEGSEQPTGSVMQRFAPWGHGGRPVAGSEYIAVSPGAGSALALIGIANAGYGRQDLKEGETQTYCKVAGCEMFLDENGTIHVNAPSGQTVIITADVVYLGSNLFTQYVALANLVNAELGKVQAALIAHTHTGVTIGAGITGTSSSTYAPSDVSATKVKAV